MAVAEPMVLRFEVAGDQAVEHHLLGIGARAVDMAPVLEVIAERLRLKEADWFASEGDGSWAPLAESTVAYKAANNLRPEILRATDDLMRSLTEEGAPGQFSIVTPDALIFGTSIDYARYHRDGAGGLPVRNPLGIGPGDLVEFTKEVQAYILGAEAGEMRSLGGGNIPWSIGAGPFP